MFYALIYVSSATVEFGRMELEALLNRSRERNARLGFSGMLLYKDGNFMQVLEGEREKVQALYDKIERDPRHRGTLILLKQEIEDRQFPDWSMGFRDLEIADNTRKPGYNEFLNMPLTDSSFMENPSQAQKLLQVFERSM